MVTFKTVCLWAGLGTTGLGATGYTIGNEMDMRYGDRTDTVYMELVTRCIPETVKEDSIVKPDIPVPCTLNHYPKKADTVFKCPDMTDSIYATNRHRFDSATFLFWTQIRNTNKNIKLKSDSVGVVIVHPKAGPIGVREGKNQ